MLKKLSTVQKAFLALIVANVIWGAAAPIFKLSLQNIPPFTLAFLRFFLASILLLVILRRNAALPIANRRDTLLLVANSLLGITGNIIFFFLGLKLTLALNAPVIASSAPIITLLFAMLLLREKFYLRKLVGMLLGTAGILLIIFQPLIEVGFVGSVVGNLFLVLATLGAVGGTITGRRLFPRYPPLTLTFWSFIIGSASFLPLAIYEYLQAPNLYALLDWRGYLGIGFGAILSSAASYALFNWGVSKISATDTSMFTYIDPVVGTILAFLLLHEPITWPFVLGTVFIFGGIFLAEGRLHYHPFGKLRKPPKIVSCAPEVTRSVDRAAALRRIFKH